MLYPPPLGPRGSSVRWFGLCLLLGAVVFVTGCTKKGGDTNSVTGKVTLDGKNVSGTVVFLYPADNKELGTPINPDGSYNILNLTRAGQGPRQGDGRGSACFKGSASSGCGRIAQDPRVERVRRCSPRQVCLRRHHPPDLRGQTGEANLQHRTHE